MIRTLSTFKSDMADRRHHHRPLTIEALERRHLLATGLPTHHDVNSNDVRLLPPLLPDVTVVESALSAAAVEQQPVESIPFAMGMAAMLDNNLQVVDLSDLTGDVPLDVVSTTQILSQTEDWEHPTFGNPNWPLGGGDTVGFPSVVRNDHGPNPDRKYYLYYAHHDPRSGIGVAVSDSITGPYSKNVSVPGRSDNLVVPAFHQSSSNPDDPDHTSSPWVVWNEDEQLWFVYFHYFNHIRNVVPGFQLTAMATTADLASHNWTIWQDASLSGTTPRYVPVLPTTSDTWISEASSYNTVHRLPDGTWLAFLRGTSTIAGDPTKLGFATSADARNWNYFSENPVIHQNDGGGGRTGVYRPGFIAYLGPDSAGDDEYLVAWEESHFFDGDARLIFGYTTDFKSVTRDPRGHVDWEGADGPISAWREGDRLYLFSGKVVHEIVLPVPSSPSVPGPLSTADVLDRRAMIAWGASTDPQGDPVTYELQYRRDDLSDNWSNTLTASATSLTITGLQANTTYRARVRATDGQAASDWLELAKLFTTLPLVPTFDIGEFGTLTDVTNVSQTIVLDRTYDDPVVLAQSASTNGQDAVVVRVANVQPDRFSVYVAESSGGDGTHNNETVTYVVLESGNYRLADATKLEVGTLATSATVGGMISNQWATVSLAENFFHDVTPVLFTQVQTDSGAAFLATRQNNVTTTSFDVALEPEEASTSQHNAETVGYLAIEPGTHATGDILLEADYTPANVSQDWYTLAFDRQYGAPGLLTSLASYVGSDNAHVRYRNLSGGNVELKIGEDTSFDSETNHTAESVAYLALGGSGMLQATVGQLEIGQFGVITDLTNQAQTIVLDRTFSAPVVFAQSPTANGGQPVTVRVDNVLPDRFSIYLAEPSNEDGTHVAETVTYLVLEAGEHQLADGTQLEVGTRTTSASVGQLVTDQWESVTFGDAFDSTPVVLTQIQTVTGVPYLQTRQDAVNAASFQVALQQEEAIATPHVPETLGYLAIEPGAGVWNGHVFEAGNTGMVVTDTAATFDFDRRFPGVPALLASMNSYVGKDSAHVRYRNLSDQDVDLLIGEDTTVDTELAHGDEDVAYLALGGSGMLTAMVAQLAIGEVGLISDLTNNVQTIVLDRTYQAPVVFAQSPTANGAQPAVVRVDNVLADRFSIYLAEPSNEDGNHAAEMVTYVVLEAGVHQLADGTRLEVGTRTTGATVGQSVADQWEPVAFADPFSSAPVVLTQIQTVSGVPYLVTRQTAMDANGFQLGLHQEEAITTQHDPETVGYLAIESGAGVWNGHVFEAIRTPTVVTETWTTISFSQSFSTVPALLTSLGSYFGRDNSHLRYRNLSVDDVQLQVGEDTTADTERVHAAEQVGYLAIGSLGLLTAKAPLAAPVVASVMRDGGADTHDTLDTLAVTFDQSVVVAARDLTLRNDSAGGTLVNLAEISLAYDAVTRTAVWDFSGVDGIVPAHYTAILSSSGITNAAGMSLDGDADGNAGGDYTSMQLVAARGDADLDGDVDILDFNTLATSFDPLGIVLLNGWQQGNFDGDTDVDIADFTALVRNFRPLGYASETSTVLEVRDEARDIDQFYAAYTSEVAKLAGSDTMQRELPRTVAAARRPVPYGEDVRGFVDLASDVSHARRRKSQHDLEQTYWAGPFATSNTASTSTENSSNMDEVACWSE